MPKQSNVLREDVVKATPAEPLLERSPQREDQLFVVPVILKN
jgi:Asp-tRNA(Asn)/Glu-tRNA(Gln) amidotransferase C subunit